MEGRDRRWRAAIYRGKRYQVEESDRRWKKATAGGGERSQVDGSDHRWSEAIAGGGERCIGGKDIR